MSEVHYPHSAQPRGPAVVHHEESDADITAVFGFGAGLAVVTVIVGVIVLLLFNYLSGREVLRLPPQYPLAAGQKDRLPPEPRLQTNPRQDLSDLRAGEDQQLQTYGWVDKSAGVVRIPIDEAMKIVVQRGLPARRESR